MARNWGVAEWLDERGERFTAMSDDIWAHPQVALAETYACALQADALEADGFRVTRNVGDLPTAFVAEWGSGGPVIGFLGEYDALPDLSQKVGTSHDPVVLGGPGHGCGHNLLGTASLASASALKAWLEETGRPGTVRYYGCPAEETGAGKVFMARAGVFDDLDAAFTWHPWQNNTIWVSSSLAIDHITFRFHGETAHAAGSPETGRSALDAVELMNIGVNFLREHVIEKARIHYVITNGGGQPNVVPAEAEVWYYVRAPERDQVDALTARVRKCAEGAAHMTETRLEVLDAYGVHNYLPSYVLSDLSFDVLQELGPIDFTAEEAEYASAISSAFPETNRRASLRSHDIPESVLNDGVYGAITPMGERGKVLSGSTDVSEVSWITPTVQVLTTCFALGVPGHSWAVTATGGMSIGHKGMLHAAKVMAVAAAELWDRPELLAEARAEHQRLTNGRTYTAPIPEGAAPPKPHI